MKEHGTILFTEEKVLQRYICSFYSQLQGLFQFVKKQYNFIMSLLCLLECLCAGYVCIHTACMGKHNLPVYSVSV